MGHEYVEIKNVNAAIASYRRAVGKCSLLTFDAQSHQDSQT